MPECVKCGSYTKYNGGLCLKCYKTDKSAESVNNWVENVIKGRIAETIIEELFKKMDFQVFRYGMENSIPGITELLKGVRSEVSKNIRQMPDYVIFKDKQAHFVEVKFRKNETFTLKDANPYGDYPFENALFVVVSPKHIKCISYEELKKGDEVTPKSRNYLGSRKEFDTDKEMIVDFCNVAVKFFENV